MKSSTIITSIVAVLAVGAIAVFTLMGKGTTSTTDNSAEATQELTTTPSDTATTTGVADMTTGTTQTQSSDYKDGTYTASATYRTPESTEPITVTLTLASDVVTDVSFTSNPQAPETHQYQSQFASGYKQFVVGKNIDDIQISRVSGSSLTSMGFKAALEKIKAEAKA